MKIVTEIKHLQNLRTEWATKRIGFVPTMGHLHAGHLSLCERSILENDLTVVSIFVNPTQFNNENDFEHYPKTVEKDVELLEAQSIDYLFLPKAQEIYSDNYEIQVAELQLSQDLEGAYRPGHFTGMLTIVLKLLNLVQPTKTYVGEKDYQQYLLIKKMKEALFLSSDIIACMTIRAEDGLALSSRNSRLTEKQRDLAAHFPKLLQSPLTTKQITHQLTQLGFKVDYIVDKWQRRLGAVWLEEIRLIDNVPITNC
jgi:pantoate--beta-alanine ligase